MNPALINRANELLLEHLSSELLKHCRLLHDNGFTRDEINEVLKQRIPEMERWRSSTLNRVIRWYQNPDAPSHELQ
jgi:hypothetical protein